MIDNSNHKAMSEATVGEYYSEKLSKKSDEDNEVSE